MTSWFAEQAAIARQAGEMQEAAWDAAVAATEQRLRARRLRDEQWGKPSLACFIHERART